MYVKPDVMDGSQLHLAGKRTRWPETETLGRGTISLIRKTPSMIDVCKAGCNRWVATSLGRENGPDGRKPKPLAGKRFHLFGKRRR